MAHAVLRLLSVSWVKTAGIDGGKLVARGAVNDHQVRDRRIALGKIIEMILQKTAIALLSALARCGPKTSCGTPLTTPID